MIEYRDEGLIEAIHVALVGIRFPEASAIRAAHAVVPAIVAQGWVPQWRAEEATRDALDRAGRAEWWLDELVPAVRAFLSDASEANRELLVQLVEAFDTPIIIAAGSGWTP